jgi:hypothetical protein
VVELRKAPQKRQVRIAPFDDLVVVIAVRDRGADDQEQNLAKPIGDLPGLPRSRDLRKVIEQQASRGLAENADKSSIGPSRITRQLGPGNQCVARGATSF